MVNTEEINIKFNVDQTELDQALNKVKDAKMLMTFQRQTDFAVGFILGAVGGLLVAVQVWAFCQ